VAMRRKPPARNEMEKLPNVRLKLANSPANVLLVRQALGGLADAIGLDRVELNDMNTAVTEACNNVVVHAYGEAEGPLEVELYALPAQLCVVVRDHGGGIDPDVDESQRGIGLRLIEALCDSVRFGDVPGGGTELRMSFHTELAGALGVPRDARGLELSTSSPNGSETTMRIAIAPSRLARAVLPRVLAALAVHADFSTDRISDTQLLADALIARIDGSLSASHVNVGVSVAPRNLELRIGPLRTGTAEALVLDSAVADLGSVLERLTEGRHGVQPAGRSEILTLRLAGQR
jgi:serine/threonine-protein kinase RsbW